MDEKLSPQSFTSIFKESFPRILAEMPKKAFIECVEDLRTPYLSQSEKDCIESFAKKYLASVDAGLIYFSKKLI